MIVAIDKHDAWLAIVPANLVAYHTWDALDRKKFGVTPAAAVVRECLTPNSWSYFGNRIYDHATLGGSVVPDNWGDFTSYYKDARQDMRDGVHPLLVIDRVFHASLFHHKNGGYNLDEARERARSETLLLIQYNAPQLIHIDIFDGTPSDRVKEAT